MYKDSAKFGLFSAVFSCSYKLILCTLRRLGSKSDKVNAPIAGFLSAWSLAIEARGRKQILLVLVLCRAVDSLLNIGEEKGISIAPPKVKYVLLFMIANLYIQSLMGFH